MKGYLKMLGRHWMFSDKGSCLPDRYVCIDAELSGLNPHKDVMVQIGHCLVVKGEIQEYQEFYLDWVTDRILSPAWLSDRLRQTKDAIEYSKDGHRTGERYDITIDILREKGQDPYQVLKYYHQKILQWKEQDLYFVAHNFETDESAISRMAERWANAFPIGFIDDLKFPDNRIVDTGTIAKGIQSGCVPQNRETLRAFMVRAKRAGGSKYKWALASYCVPTYLQGLAELEKVHSAGYDAALCYQLMEVWRAEGDSATASVNYDFSGLVVDAEVEVPTSPPEEGQEVRKPRSKKRTQDAQGEARVPSIGDLRRLRGRRR